MRDRHEGARADLLRQALQHRGLRARIHGAGGFIEDQHRRLADQGARDGHRLALPPRQAFAPLAQAHAVALRVLSNEVVHARHLRRVQHLGVGGVVRAQGDVLPHRAAQQPHILQHHAQGAPQVGRVQLAHVHAVDQHRTGVRLVQAEDQLGHRRLARAHLAENGHALARLDLEGHVIQRRPGGARVAEGDVAKLDGALEALARQVTVAVLVLARLVHEVVQQLVAVQRLVDAREQLRDLRHRRHRATRQDGAGDDGPHAQVAVGHHQRTHGHHPHLHRLLRKGRDVAGQLGEKPRLQPHLGLVRHGLLPALAHQGPGTQRLDRLQAAERLHQDGVLVVPVLLRFLDQAGQRRLHHHTGHQHDGNGDEHHPDHRPADHPDDGDEDQRERHVDERGERGRGQEVADGLELLERAGQGTAAAAARLHLRVQDLLEQGIGNRAIGARAGQIQEVAAHGADDEVTDEDDAHAHQQRHQRVRGVVGDHAVVDDHREDRARQGEHVDQQRRQRRLHVDPARALDRAPKPVAVAAQRGALQRCTGDRIGHGDVARSQAVGGAGQAVVHLLQWKRPGLFAGVRVDHQHLPLLIDAQQGQGRALARLRNRRQGGQAGIQQVELASLDVIAQAVGRLQQRLGRPDLPPARHARAQGSRGHGPLLPRQHGTQAGLHGVVQGGLRHRGHGRRGSVSHVSLSVTHRQGGALHLRPFSQGSSGASAGAGASTGTLNIGARSADRCRNR